MCFYVNLRELWPFGSFFFFSRPSNSGNNNNCKTDTNKRERTRRDDNDGVAADVDGKLARWKEPELAPHWLLTSEAFPGQKATTTGEDQHLLAPATANRQQTEQAAREDRRHYGSNLLASLSSGRALALDGGPLATEKAKTEEQQQQQQDARPPGERAQIGDALTSSSQGRAMSEQAPPADGGAPAPDSYAMQSQLQQQQQHLKQDLSHLVPEPSQQALAEAATFRVRTAARRHLDFDAEFELSDVEAPQRSKWAGPFHFIQAADCQFGMIDSYVHHRIQPGWREEIQLCERLVSLCNAMQPKPKFMIICGDLVDSLPGSALGRKQVVDFKRIFAKLDPSIPLVCVCGNHDVGDEPTSKTIEDYRSNFGEDYFYFTRNDILFIVINSQFYQNRQQVQEEARRQDEWLERLLDKCRLFKYSIIFEHIPWFLERPDEENDYFNIRKEVRLEWLEKFKRAGVTKIMCGHYHRNAGGWFDGMELVVTSAIGAQCGSDRSGIRIVRVLDKSIEHQYYAMEDVPLRVELGGEAH